jgi:hypothetical protein
LQCVSEQDHWDEMMNEMEIYYSQHHTKLRPVENLVTDRLYVGCHDGDWCRLEYIGSSDDVIKDLILNHVDFFFKNHIFFVCFSLYMLSLLLSIIPMSRR